MARGGALRRFAYLMCGDWHEAEDLVQDSLVKLYVHWPKVHREGSPDAWVRRVLVNKWLDDRKSARRRREDRSGFIPESPVEDAYLPPERELLMAALATVPKSQRAVLVLRFWEGMSVYETAEALGCTTGNVKSQSARGLEKLRQVLPKEKLW